MGAFVQELFSLSLYKRSQGRLARQATFAALAIIVALGAWSLHNYYKGVYFGATATNDNVGDEQTVGGEQTLSETESPPATVDTTSQFVWVNVIPIALLAGGLWTSFRIVQMPSFADFLISVEGEMNKVSWPARGELFRASIVVMFVIFFLAGILFAYDLVLTELMRAITWLLSTFSSWFG